jgi:hypothetical protein
MLEQQLTHKQVLDSHWPWTVMTWQHDRYKLVQVTKNVKAAMHHPDVSQNSFMVEFTISRSQISSLWASPTMFGGDHG